jgi:hypothetical protein
MNAVYKLKFMDHQKWRKRKKSNVLQMQYIIW